MWSLVSCLRVLGGQGSHRSGGGKGRWAGSAGDSQQRLFVPLPAQEHQGAQGTQGTQRTQGTPGNTGDTREHKASCAAHSGAACGAGCGAGAEGHCWPSPAVKGLFVKAARADGCHVSPVVPPCAVGDQTRCGSVTSHHSLRGLQGFGHTGCPQPWLCLVLNKAGKGGSSILTLQISPVMRFSSFAWLLSVP